MVVEVEGRQGKTLIAKPCHGALRGFVVVALMPLHRILYVGKFTLSSHRVAVLCRKQPDKRQQRRIYGTSLSLRRG